MQLLAAIGHINDFVRVPIIEAMSQSCQVSRGVVESAIALLNQRGIFLQLRDVIEKDSERSFAFASNAFVAQFMDQRLETRVIEAFAQGVIESHTEPLINGIELGLREGDHLAPDAEVLLVAGLQLDQFLPSGVEHSGIGFAGGVDLFIDSLHLGDRFSLERSRIEVMFPANQQLAELGAPIAEMIISDDPMAEEAQYARQAIAKNGGTNMADVHRLGDIGRTEVEDDGKGAGCHLEEKIFAPSSGLQCRSQGGGLEPEIKKAGTGDFHGFAPFMEVESGEDISSDLPRVQFAALGEGDQGIGLIIAELRVRTWADEDGSGSGVREDGFNGLLEGLFN